MYKDIHISFMLIPSQILKRIIFTQESVRASEHAGVQVIAAENKNDTLQNRVSILIMKLSDQFAGFSFLRERRGAYIRFLKVSQNNNGIVW